MSATLLWIIAAILVVVGIVQLIQGQIILGIVLIVAGCLVGPGGYSLFRSRTLIVPAEPEVPPPHRPPNPGEPPTRIIPSPSPEPIVPPAPPEPPDPYVPDPAPPDPVPLEPPVPPIAPDPTDAGPVASAAGSRVRRFSADRRRVRVAPSTSWSGPRSPCSVPRSTAGDTYGPSLRNGSGAHRVDLTRCRRSTSGWPLRPRPPDAFLVHRAGGDLFGRVLGLTAIEETILDVLVLPLPLVAPAALWHRRPPGYFGAPGAVGGSAPGAQRVTPGRWGGPAHTIATQREAGAKHRNRKCSAHPARVVARHEGRRHEGPRHEGRARSDDPVARGQQLRLTARPISSPRLVAVHSETSRSGPAARRQPAPSGTHRPADRLLHKRVDARSPPRSSGDRSGRPAADRARLAEHGTRGPLGSRRHGRFEATGAAPGRRPRRSQRRCHGRVRPVVGAATEAPDHHHDGGSSRGCGAGHGGGGHRWAARPGAR